MWNPRFFSSIIHTWALPDGCALLGQPIEGAGRAAHDILATAGSRVCGPKETNPTSSPLQEANPTSSLLQETPSSNDSCLCMSTLPLGHRPQWVCQRGLERELPQRIDEPNGRGGEEMSQPGLGVELEERWQGLGVHQSSTGGCPTYLTAAEIPRSFFLPRRSPGAHRVSWKAGVCKLDAALALKGEAGLSYRASWRIRQGFWAGDWDFSGYCRAIFSIQCLVPCLTIKVISINSDTAVYISIYYRNWILFYQSLLSAGEGTNFSHSGSAASICLSLPHCPCLQWLLFLSSVKTVQSTPSATKGALMDNLIPNTEMIRGAGRLYYSQREAEQAKVVLQAWNLPKIAIWKAHGGAGGKLYRSVKCWKNLVAQGKRDPPWNRGYSAVKPQPAKRAGFWCGQTKHEVAVQVVNESNKSGRAFNYTHCCWTKSRSKQLYFPHRRKDTISLKLSWCQRSSVLLFFQHWLYLLFTSLYCWRKGTHRVLQRSTTVFSLTASADWKVPSCWVVYTVNMAKLLSNGVNLLCCRCAGKNTSVLG